MKHRLTLASSEKNGLGSLHSRRQCKEPEPLQEGSTFGCYSHLLVSGNFRCRCVVCRYWGLQSVVSGALCTHSTSSVTVVRVDGECRAFPSSWAKVSMRSKRSSGSFASAFLMIFSAGGGSFLQRECESVGVWRICLHTICARGPAKGRMSQNNSCTTIASEY